MFEKEGEAAAAAAAAVASLGRYEASYVHNLRLVRCAFPRTDVVGPAEKKGVWGITNDRRRIPTESYVKYKQKQGRRKHRLKRCWHWG